MTTDTGDSDIREIRPMLREFIGEMKESRWEFDSRIGKLEDGLRAMRRDVIGLKEVYSGMRKDISYMDEDMELMEERVRELEEKTEYAERYSRRENILIYDMKAVSRFKGSSPESVGQSVTKQETGTIEFCLSEKWV
ncbi:hypothetical protein ElyMa_005705900 [Elysia marginata]|uniref:IF rod domain-containing protein n=1 Tax=Elysia marginata TaxID=1093978 RepID=A0AAV4FGB1_9GAST|nr:hypothetical protein ElyMa_005705900 [Elysia marginata]